MNIKDIKSFIKEYQDTPEADAGVFLLQVTAEIYAMMKRKKVSQKSLADKLKCSEANLSRMLSGEQNLTLETLYRIYAALGEEPQIVCKSSMIKNIVGVYYEESENKIVTGAIASTSQNRPAQFISGHITHHQAQ